MSLRDSIRLHMSLAFLEPIMADDMRLQRLLLASVGCVGIQTRLQN